ncbi:MAG: hypothetical protein AAB344_02030, partial [Bacteroidota bacterium]
MKSHQSDRKLIEAILSGTYTPFELREFLQFCYSLALPFIRKKIRCGKINCDIIGLQEADIIHDCLADLFYRDEANRFPQIQIFFENQLVHSENPSDEEFTIVLRRLVLGKVNNNIIRLYSEADPALGKILRNLKLALERTQLFEQVSRFGETYLMPRGIKALLHLPPIREDCIREAFSRIVCVYDNIPEMLRKLYSVLSEVQEFQRAVTLVSAALLFKEVYKVAWEEESNGGSVEQHLPSYDIKTLIEQVCKRMSTEMHPVYVGSGRRSDEVFRCYMRALNGILIQEFAEDSEAAETYYE